MEQQSGGQPPAEQLGELAAQLADATNQLEALQQLPGSADPIVADFRERVKTQLHTTVRGLEAAQERAALGASLTELRALLSFAQGELLEKIETQISKYEERLAALGAMSVGQATEKAEPDDDVSSDGSASNAKTQSTAAHQIPEEPLAGDSNEAASNTPGDSTTEVTPKETLDKYLSPQTSLVCATFLDLIRTELETLGYDPIDRNILDALLDTYRDTFTSTDIQQERDAALRTVNEMLQDPVIFERVFYELADPDPRGELFLYMVNLFQVDAGSTYKKLQELLKVNREQIVELITPGRSGPHVASLTLVSPPMVDAAEATAPPRRRDLQIEEAGLLATFIHTISLEGHDQLHLANNTVLALVSQQNAITLVESLTGSTLIARINDLLDWASDPHNILFAISRLTKEDDPRHELLTALYDIVTSSDEGLVDALRNYAQDIAFLRIPEQQAPAAESTAAQQAAKPQTTKQNRPPQEVFCRRKVGEILDRLSTLDLTKPHSVHVYASLLGSNVRKAVGSAKEHGIASFDRGQVPAEELIYSLLRLDRKTTEFAQRNEDWVRQLIQKGVQNIVGSAN